LFRTEQFSSCSFWDRCCFESDFALNGKELGRRIVTSSANRLGYTSPAQRSSLFLVRTFRPALVTTGFFTSLIDKSLILSFTLHFVHAFEVFSHFFFTFTRNGHYSVIRSPERLKFSIEWQVECVFSVPFSFYSYSQISES
jgi:hypothetical protein